MTGSVSSGDRRLLCSPSVEYPAIAWDRRAGGRCARRTPKPGSMPSRSIGLSAPACAAFVARSTSTARPYPLDEADLSTAANRYQLDLWLNECEDLCGV